MEVNVFLAFCFFVWSNCGIKGPKMVKFWKKMALAIMENKFIVESDQEKKRKGRRKRRRDPEVHVLGTASPYAKCWKGVKWDCLAKAKYQQYTC